MVAIADYKKETILRAVQDMYTQVAQNPAQVTHCLLGRAAARLAGYADAQLDNLPGERDRILRRRGQSVPRQRHPRG